MQDRADVCRQKVHGTPGKVSKAGALGWWEKMPNGRDWKSGKRGLLQKPETTVHKHAKAGGGEGRRRRELRLRTDEGCCFDSRTSPQGEHQQYPHRGRPDKQALFSVSDSGGLCSCFINQLEKHKEKRKPKVTSPTGLNFCE